MNTASKNVIKISVSILIGGAFLWLALRSVDLQEVGELWSRIQTGWIPYFVVATLASFWLRMERWKLLAEHDRIPSKRRILLAGVMNGYAVNYAVPRLGEITRCYYVAKKEDKPVAAIMGTVVLERIIDLVVLLVLMLVVFFFVFTDSRLIIGLLGLDNAEELGGLYMRLLIVMASGVAAIAFLWWLLAYVAARNHRVDVFRKKLVTFAIHFKDGLLSIRSIQHPLRFLFFTIGLWCCYIVMAGLPFSMLPDSGMELLGGMEALVITVVSSVGVVIPSPGGIGTYHLLVQKSLFILYGIPETAGFTYALVSHALVFMTVIVTTPVVLMYAGGASRRLKGK